MTLRLS